MSLRVKLRSYHSLSKFYWRHYYPNPTNAPPFLIASYITVIKRAILNCGYRLQTFPHMKYWILSHIPPHNFTIKVPYGWLGGGSWAEKVANYFIICIKKKCETAILKYLNYVLRCYVWEWMDFFFFIGLWFYECGCKIFTLKSKKWLHPTEAKSSHTHNE